MKFKLGMGQILVRYSKKAENLNHACDIIHRASEQGCRIVVLPECLDIGWVNPNAFELAETVPGNSSQKLSRAAQKSSIFVIAGLTEKAQNRIYNTAVLLSPNGDILMKYRKINVLTVAQDIYSTGNCVSVVETELGKIGVNICADNWPNCLSLGDSLARMGAEILLSPSVWAVEPDHDNTKDPYGEIWERSYTTLAKLYDMTIIGVSSVGWVEAGVWKGRKCIGCSLAIGPGGKVLARGPYGVDAERLIGVEVEPRPLPVTGTAIADVLKAKGYDTAYSNIIRPFPVQRGKIISGKARE